MKKILILLTFLTVSVTAMAQYVPAAKRSGGTVKLDGSRLKPKECLELFADIDGEDYTAEWTKARGWRAGGIAMISAGAGVMAIGGGLTLVGLMASMLGATIGGAVGAIGGQDGAQAGANQGAKAGEPYIVAGLVVGGVGLATHIAGIPVTAVSCTKMSRLIDKYNDSQMPAAEEKDIQLSFGFTQHGVGLSMTF